MNRSKHHPLDQSMEDGRERGEEVRDRGRKGGMDSVHPCFSFIPHSDRKVNELRAISCELQQISHIIDVSQQRLHLNLQYPPYYTKLISVH